MKTKTIHLEKYVQVVPREMIDALRESAQAKGLSLDMEIALRLSIGMAEAEIFAANNVSHQVINYTFSSKMAVAECKRKRLSALYIFEMEKLRLYLSFTDQLPRSYKEHFTVIDVKEATARIKSELAAEKIKNNKQAE